ncbi:MAG: hypothetical protein KJZ57_08510, partial [Anaerolineales bacterium]|nr:hypothetical protein [Anaerolineales bacterium]
STQNLTTFPPGFQIWNCCPEGSKLEDNTCYILTSGVEIAPLQFQLVLMVTYELAEPGTGLTKASDRLIQFELRPVGE